MGFAAADVGRVNEVDDAAVASVEAGVSFFAAEVEGVDGEISIVDGGEKAVGRIVERVGVGVRAADLEAVVEALVDLDLQTVVPGVAAGLIAEGVEEGVVVDGVKGEHAFFSAGVKRIELKDGRIDAEGEKLVDQSGLRRRAIDDAENACAVVADVVGVDGEGRGDLALDAEVPGNDAGRLDVVGESAGEDEGFIGDDG